MADEGTAQAVEEKTEETAQDDSQTQAQSVEFPDAAGEESSGANTSIDILLEMSVSVTVAIGKVKLPIQRLLQLGPGSVLKLDKSIEAPVDLYLKDSIFATGNVVVVEDMFAIKIKQILGPGAIANNNEQ